MTEHELRKGPDAWNPNKDAWANSRVVSYATVLKWRRQGIGGHIRYTQPNGQRSIFGSRIVVLVSANRGPRWTQAWAEGRIEPYVYFEVNGHKYRTPFLSDAELAERSARGHRGGTNG